MKSYLAAAALAAMFVSGAAHATAVSYSSSGSFSGLTFTGNPNTSCGQAAAFFPCSISSSGGTNNVLNMSGYDTPSTLKANTVSGTVNVPPNDPGQVVGNLTWTNNSTFGADPSFAVTFNFNLGFNSSSDSQAFSLTITQPTNPPGDNVLALSNSTLSALGPYSVAGVSISNIHFALAPGQSAYSTYDGTNWHLNENHTATINVLADITSTATPEPASMVVLGTALVGLGMVRRRARRA